MSASADFIAHLIELLAGLGPVQTRRMFGGAGLYADGVMFALIIDDVLYLKADDATRAAFARAGMAPFTYDAKGRSVATSYWRAPEHLYDEPDDMCEWAHTAIAAARRTRARKPTAKTSRRR